MKKISVTKRFTFEASHYLPNYKGACSKLHGHSYKLEVTVSGNINDSGMVIDFKDLKRIIEELIINKYDHDYLNLFFYNPTVENMANVFFDRIEKELLEQELCLERIRLWETEDSYAEVTKISEKGESSC